LRSAAEKFLGFPAAFRPRACAFLSTIGHRLPRRRCNDSQFGVALSLAVRHALPISEEAQRRFGGVFGDHFGHALFGVLASLEKERRLADVLSRVVNFVHAETHFSAASLPVYFVHLRHRLSPVSVEVIPNLLEIRYQISGYVSTGKREENRTNLSSVQMTRNGSFSAQILVRITLLHGPP
jgi:hypothetical protein